MLRKKQSIIDNQLSTIIGASRAGQALIIMILVMGVALTIGLAISGRTIMTLRQISYSSQSAKALSFAEAGLEHALMCVKQGTCGAGDSGSLNVDGEGGDDCDYSITALGVSNYFDKLSPITRDNAVQLDLNGYPASRRIYINWVDYYNPSEMSNPAAMEASVIYTDGSGNYRKSVFAWDPDGSRRLGPNGNYLNPMDGASSTLNPGWVGSTYYRHRLLLPQLTNYGGCASGCQYRILRLRALYSDIPNSFAIQGVGANLPSQGVEIASTGYSGKVRRKVLATRATPTLPTLFDFVLFSGSTSDSLTK